MQLNFPGRFTLVIGGVQSPDIGVGQHASTIQFHMVAQTYPWISQSALGCFGVAIYMRAKLCIGMFDFGKGIEIAAKTRFGQPRFTVVLAVIHR